MAHELRTPLTNLRGYLEALTDQVVPPTTQTFTLLMDETMRLASLVEDVLQLARADASHGKLQLEPIDLKDALAKVLAGFGAQFQQKDIIPCLQAPPHSVVIQADRVRLMRVLRNLADNAVRYAPAGSVVNFCLTMAPDAARIESINPAGGVTAEDLPFLFERFYRGEKSRSREHGGAGIGLSIVKELVEAHGGSAGSFLADDLIHIFVTLPTIRKKYKIDLP